MGKHVAGVWLMLLVMMLFTGCSDEEAKEAEKWRISLKADNKKPYGCYLAYNSLKYYFPDAAISELSGSYRYNNISTSMMQPEEGHNLMVLTGLDLYLSDDEWQQLSDFVRAGNELVIFGSSLGSQICAQIHCHPTGSGEELPLLKTINTAKGNEHCLTLTNAPGISYGYKGRSLKAYFASNKNYDNYTDSTDSADGTVFTADTLGSAAGNPDFMRFTLGSGHLTVHAAPLVTSNYFLLQPGNLDYLTAIWRSLPQHITHVYWNSYYKHSPEDAQPGILWRYEPTRWALIICIITAAVYVLFQMKRRQRIVPVIPPLKNDSVSFVETVGRLYYNKGNHANLAEKMIQQFLEWVRMHYYLNTNILNDEFARQLEMKSGKPAAMVQELMTMIRETRTGSAIPDDAYLYQLYRIIQQFYKNN